MNKKITVYLLITVLFLSLSVQPTMAEASTVEIQAGSAISAPEAPDASPVVSIPTHIPAGANDLVDIPVNFSNGGNDIGSMAFSVDYDNTWLDFDPTTPFSITMNLPAGFTGDCEVDKSDTDGEIDCYIFDPVVPIGSVPDGVVATIRLVTLDAPNDTVAPVGFSQDPHVTFGDPHGQYVPGASTNGSVIFVEQPAAPTSLSTTLNSCIIQLDWLDNSINEEGFSIERRTNYTPFAEIAVVGPNVTQYVDSGLSPNTLYFYRVRAFNIAGYSAYTNEAWAITDAVCTYKNYLPIIFNNFSTGSSISGTVRDGGGLPLQDVSVCADGQCDLSTASGYYSIGGLDADIYNLFATKEGYACTPSFVNPVVVPPSASGKDFVCVPSACSNLIQNGGFEDRYAWEIPYTEYTAGYSTDMAHSGVSSMRTGIVEPAHNQYSYSSARQLITIPWDSTSATLRLYRYPMSSDVLYREQGGLPMMPAMPVEGINVGEMVLSDDIQMVLILDYYDNILSTLMWGLSDAQRWQYREFDLLNYKGWTIKVYLGTYNDGYGGNTSQHFDDVSLEVCQ